MRLEPLTAHSSSAPLLHLWSAAQAPSLCGAWRGGLLRDEATRRDSDAAWTAFPRIA